MRQWMITKDLKCPKLSKKLTIKQVKLSLKKEMREKKCILSYKEKPMLQRFLIQEKKQKKLNHIKRETTLVNWLFLRVIQEQLMFSQEQNVNV